MTQPVKRFFFLFITVLAGFSLSFYPLVTFAQSDSTLRITDHLINQVVDSSPIDITNSYYSVFLKSFNPLHSADNDLNVDAFKRDYARAQNSGTIILLQVSSVSSEKKYSFVSLYFNYKRDCSVSLQKENNNYYLYTGSADRDCRFRSARFDANPVANYYGNSSVSNRVMISSVSHSIFSYSGEYTVDNSANGTPALPKANLISTDPPTFDWNDNCGLDVVCHLGNIGNAVKTVFSLVLGIFDFSENNTILRFLKWLFIPEDITELLDFSDLADRFKNALDPVYKSVELLKRLYEVFVPSVEYWSSSNYCSTSPVGDAGIQDSASHRYIIESKIFGYKFEPDICSFERAIGGFTAMAQIRLFSSCFLIAISLLLWYRFIVGLTGERL